MGISHHKHSGWGRFVPCLSPHRSQSSPGAAWGSGIVPSTVLAGMGRALGSLFQPKAFPEFVILEEAWPPPAPQGWAPALTATKGWD